MPRETTSVVSGKLIDVQFSESDLILVTGATGLVGSHVAEQARAKGLRVRALCRAGSDTTLLRQWGVEIIDGDLGDVSAPAMMERSDCASGASAVGSDGGASAGTSGCGGGAELGFPLSR